MNKQDIIREGIDAALLEFAEGWLSNTELKQKLSGLGVVIKVDNGNDLTGCCIARLEPLIEDE